MGFWSWLKNADPSGITANANASSSVGAPAWNPGDPDGVVMDRSETFSRSLPVLSPSPWSGWPASWNVPGWGDDTASKLGNLVDTAWHCIDLNSSVLSSMPVYRTQNGKIVPPVSWMENPDPTIYNSWDEFGKQFVWDYHLGEVFVLAMSRYANGYPASFRVIPPPMWKVEMNGGVREYKIGDVPFPAADVLHIRYKSTTSAPHGTGPLQSVGARMTTAGVLSRYVSDMVQSGGTPHYALVMDSKITEAEADRMLQRWIDSRSKNLGQPAVLGGGVSIQTYQRTAKEMALLELAQFNEARIAVQLGVPPFLAALPSGGDSLTYTNATMLFDYHDRSSLKSKARALMSALSYWALPHGQAVELNRDEYTRPTFAERAQGWKAFWETGAVTSEGIAAAERFAGATASVELSGGTLTGAGAADSGNGNMPMTPSRGGQP